ncbi:hypothetical protein Q0N22_14665, partial [Staphylococcus aureus]|nr:hypothetical protein [Staphylococcus aureus]
AKRNQSWHDFKRCVCGAIAIDGGEEYTRLTWGGDRPPFTPNLKMEHYIGFHPNYTKTSNFLLKYSWADKSEQVIVEEMALNGDEQGYLREAMEEL